MLGRANVISIELKLRMGTDTRYLGIRA